MLNESARRRRALRPGRIVLAALATLVVAATAGAAVGADRSTGGGVRAADTGGCDVSAPALSLVAFPSYADTSAEVCGIWSVEDDAYNMYANMHGYPAGDPRIAETGASQIAGMTEGILEDLTYAESSGATLSADQQGAYDWLESVDGTFQVTAAQDALNEYNKWNSEQCTYQPPNTSLFTYDTSDQEACQPPGGGSSLGQLFSGVTPPTYDEFLSYGIYDADQQLNVANALGGAKDENVVEDGITEGIGAAVAILSGAAPQITTAIGVGDSAMESFLNAIRPFAKLTIDRAQQRQQLRARYQQNARTQQRQVQLEEEGDAEDPELVSLDEGDGVDLSEAGVDLADAAEVGADSLSGAFGIVAIALTVAVVEGISVVTAAQIPGQLQANLTAAQNVDPRQAVENLISDTTGAGYVENVQSFENQLSLPPVTVGNSPSLSCPSCTVFNAPPAPPRGTEQLLHVTALYPNGTPSSWQWISPSVDDIDTWPLGVDDGTYGPPEQSLSVENGVAWTQADTSAAIADTTADGLSGYLPGGEIRYFDPSGHPQIAYVDGNQFETLTSPGSADAGGNDLGDNCATTGECTLSNSIVVMGLGGTAQLQDTVTDGTFLGQTCTANDPGTTDCLSDNLVPDGRLVPLGGSTTLTQTGSITQTGTGQLFRLTLEPDAGTPPGIVDINQYGTYANDRLDGAPDGGYVAGQTVTFQDPETSPYGFSTSYEWQIETKCPYDPANPPRDIDGVPVCSNSPDYTSGLQPDESDLSTCTTEPLENCPFENSPYWQEDPDFHGDPVTTLTGPLVSWTWPAAGTYHVRLLTTDQYGVVRQTDINVEVSAPDPGVSGVSYAAATGPPPVQAYPAVIAPVTNGDAITVTYCLTSPDYQGGSAFSTPSVDVNWGDGSPDDTGTAGATGTDPNVVFTYQPGGGCASPWAVALTHTYDVATGLLAAAQEKISVTFSDGTDPPTPSGSLPPDTSTSTTRTFYANVSPTDLGAAFLAGPQATATFTAGSGTTYTGTTSGIPAPTITSAPASGVSHDGVSCTAGLPSGTGFDAFDNNSFVVTGTPRVDAGGCYALSLSAGNSAGSAAETLVVLVDQAPTITSADSTAMAVGSPGSFTFRASGFPTPAWAVTGVSCTPACPQGLPGDLTAVNNGDGTATLSSNGSPLAAGDAGTYTVHVTAWSAAGSTTQTFTLVIGGAPVITSNATAGFTTQEDGTFTVTAAGYPAPTYTCSIVFNGSPTGCTTGLGYTLIDSNFGVYGLDFNDNGDGTATIGGAGFTSGVYPVTITATNAIGSASQTLDLYVSNTGGPSITFVPGGAVDQYFPPSGQVPAFADATFQVGSPGSLTICSDDPQDRFSLDQALPAGLQLTDGAGSGCPSGSASATVSGTPTTPLTPGSSGRDAIRVTDGANGLGFLDLTLLGPPGITSPATATFVEGQSGSFTISQGTVPSADLDGCFSLDGSLPTGLTFSDNGDNTATIAGTPTVTGPATVTVTASGCDSSTVQQSLTVDVVAPPRFTSPATAGFEVGGGGSFQVTTNADAYPPPTLSAGTLPPGVTFTDNGDGTGTLDVDPGTPATPSPVPLELTATSSSGTSQQQLDLVIGSGTSFTSPSTSPADLVATVGQPVSDVLSAAGSPAPSFTCTVSGTPCGPSNLPAGLTFTDNGDGTATIAGTASAPGAASLTLTATNGVGSPATLQLAVSAESPPAFVGTTTSDCAAATTATGITLPAGSAANWTLCGAGAPAPAVTLTGVSCQGAPASLPSGLTLTDNGDGSATLSGAPANGTGALCPAGYTLAVALSNGAGTATEDVTVNVHDQILPTSAPDTPTFVAGTANTYALTASGVPTVSFAVDPSTPLPAWLQLSDHGNGTASLTGDPPVATAGSTVNVVVDETNGVADPVAEPVTVTVASVALTAAAPPPAQIGEPYSFAFTTSAPATFGLAAGSTLPAGLALSPSGVVSGTPTELGRWPVSLSITAGSTTVTTSSINMVVEAGPHALEISQFRSFGPSGLGDWFVEVENTTSSAIPLNGWDIGMWPVTGDTPDLVPLGRSTLGPGATAVVGGPSYSLATPMPAVATGPGLTALPGGFEVVAPEGTITDLAGEAAGPSGSFAGSGAAFPASIDVTVQDAFVRTGFAHGHPADTDDNAADFHYGTALLPQAVTFTSSAPAPGLPGQNYQVAATGGASGAPVVFHLGQGSTTGTCTVAGSKVHFKAPGTCQVAATQAAAGAYLAAPTAVQDIVVMAPQAIAFTTTPPAPGRIGGTYQVAATGGASGNPVTFTVGAKSTQDACTVAGSTVSFGGRGLCVVQANQAGNTSYLPAPGATQTINVERNRQTITFTSVPPHPAVAPFFYPVTATGGGSGNPVQFTIAPSSAHACMFSQGAVFLMAPGTCVVEATQAGNDDYRSAPPVTQTIHIVAHA